MSITVNAQQALNSTQVSLTQGGTVTFGLTGSNCNLLLTTASYNLATGTSSSFILYNPLITPTNSVNTTLLSSGLTGCPQVYTSGQSFGLTNIEVVNVHPTQILIGPLQIAVLIN